MPLNDVTIRTAKPKDKPYKLSDGDGMFLHIYPNGSKYWRMKYRIAGKEKLLALGVYDEVTLREARDKRHEARKLLSQGIDPSLQKQEEKQLTSAKQTNTFRAIAAEWHHNNKNTWTEAHAARVWRRVEANLIPRLGKMDITDITPEDLLMTIRQIEKRGATELSHRVLQTCGAIFRYAIATGKAQHNITADLQGALVAHKAEHYPTINAKELPVFIKKLHDADTTLQNKLAIRLLMHTFVRQGEMRQGRWCDIDMDAAEWRIPAEFTKMRDEHIVPLSKQVLSILDELRTLTGNSPYLLPSQHRQKHPIMSENTINNVLKRMGYKGKLVGHGFRALASTTLNEMGYSPDVIERQLAHAERNKVRAAYNRAEYLPQRRELMQTWSDYLDASEGGKVIVGAFGKAVTA